MNLLIIISDHSHIDDVLKKLSIVALAKQFKSGQEAEFMDSLPKLNDSEIGIVEKATQAQSESEMWHEARKGRITASK